jgi:hypothetical protein
MPRGIRLRSGLWLGIELLELLELRAKAGPYFSGSAGGSFWGRAFFGGLFLFLFLAAAA